MPLPVPQPPIVLIARKDCTVTPTDVVSLCVVQKFATKQVRLYRWRRNHENEAWRVSLANFSIQTIDIEQLARDAKILARDHGIQLQWGEQLRAEVPFVENEVAVIEEEADNNESELSIEGRPRCPNCQTNGDTVPIAYGFTELTCEITEEADYWLGGWGYGVESPLWHCRTCGAEWGRITWSESLPPRRILYNRHSSR